MLEYFGIFVRVTMEQSKAQDIFDKYAKEYSEKYMDQSLYVPYINQMVDLMTIQPTRILDIGCGPGNLTYLLSKKTTRLGYRGDRQL